MIRRRWAVSRLRWYSKRKARTGVSIMNLEFTGNWFIDLGILGFVNLMEDVYGWDLEKLENEMSSDKNVVFYGLFPVAYLRYWLSVRNYEASEVQIRYDEIKSKLEKLKSQEEIFNKVWWDYIVPMFKEAWIETAIKKVLEKKEKGQEVPKDWKVSLGEAPFKFTERLNNLVNDYGTNSDFKSLIGKKKAIKSLTIDDIEKIEIYLESNANETLSDPMFKDIKSFQKDLQELRKDLESHWRDLIRNKPDKVSKNSIILYRLPLDHGFFKNFMFFNQSKNIWEQKELLYKLIEFNFEEESYLQKIDKAVNKLFPSDKEFPNETYTQFSTINLKNISDKLFAFLLCFPEAFNRVGGISIAFYSNSLKFSYLVNKKISITIRQKDKRLSPILSFTWRHVVDALWEFKSSWALENMYLIQYKKLDNQSQQDVEYLGISKLHAQFIIDDKIRDTLNTTVRVLDKGDNPNRWLLREFIKDRPLLPIFYRTLNLYFGQRINYVPIATLIYSAALDKVIAELYTEEASLFSDAFFHRGQSALEKAKDTVHRYFSLMFTTRELFSQESQDERKSLAYRLFSRLRRNQKYPFVNELLKELNGKDSQDVERLMRHAFENILSNDETWQSEAIPIIAGLIEGGTSNEG